MPLLHLQGFSSHLRALTHLTHPLPSHRIRLAVNYYRARIILSNTAANMLLKTGRHSVRLGQVNLGHTFKFRAEPAQELTLWILI
tara:strand:+ start:862 stop:1116 length:255 start_codon:yes stop_codon:yes gene_type:complete